MKRKHAGAVAMAKTRWRKRTKAERSAHAKMMVDARERRKAASGGLK